MKPEICNHCNTKLNWLDSDGVEYELYTCPNCSAVYNVDIEITRHWGTAKELKGKPNV